MTGNDIYHKHIDTVEFIEDWKKTCTETDGCSSGFLKKIASLFLRLFKTTRKYRCLCIQHDFDYRYGSKYGMNQLIADIDLVSGINDLGGFAFSVIAWLVSKALGIAGKFNFINWEYKRKD